MQVLRATWPLVCVFRIADGAKPSADAIVCGGVQQRRKVFGKSLAEWNLSIAGARMAALRGAASDVARAHGIVPK
ncbi:MAG TPA: hypothetical protein VL051_09005 [Burkholderiaceae bacterium]|nr:hypothetical protein [Burkholderiaceae bacterium]